MITVINRHFHKGRYTYIGRGTIWGNPFIIGKDGTREEVIEMYQIWLRMKWCEAGKVKDELIRLAKIHKKNGSIILGCSCKPKICHGDIIKQAIENISKII